MPRCLKCNAEMPNNTQDGLCPKCEALVNRAVQRNSIQVGNRPAADAEDSFLEKTGDSSRLRRSGNPAARGGVSFTAAEIRERIAARVPAQFPPQEDLPDKTADPLQIQSLRDRIPGMASGAPQSIRRPELYDSASIDGCGRVRQFFDVTLPSIRKARTPPSIRRARQRRARIPASIRPV